MVTILREGKTPNGKEVRARIRRLVHRIRVHWPTTIITIRGDGHYGRKEAMDWCDDNGVKYVFGLGPNKTLAKQIFAKLDNVCVRRAVSCDYCLAAHSYAAQDFARISPTEIDLNRHGRSSDLRRGAAARFARTLIETRGHVADGDIEAMRDAGFGDVQIVEIIALTGQFLLTNLMNNAANTVIDFPRG